MRRVPLLLSSWLGLIMLGPICANASEQVAPFDFARQVDERLSYYADQYPDITFVRLSGTPTAGLFKRLSRLLGTQAVNLDYEHDADLREALLDAQEQRITYMLEAQAPSATFYRTSRDTLSHRPFLCAITMDVEPFNKDNLAATRLMLEGSEASYTSYIPAYLRLDNKNFLNFAVDHEVFHCLDVYRNGALYPQHASDSMLFQQRLRAEARADMFAALTHLVNNGTPSMLQKLYQLRTLGVHNGDCTHHTGPLLRVATVLDTNAIQKMALARRIDLVTEFVDDFIPNLVQYTRLTEVTCMNI